MIKYEKVVKMNENVKKKRIFEFSPIFSYSYDTIKKSEFSDFLSKMRFNSDWNFDSIEQEK
jgi:hypothetical protein